MADYSVTASSVQLLSGSAQVATAGEALTGGQPFYLDNGNNSVAMKSDANASGKDRIDGICLPVSVAANQTFTYATPGQTINPGFTANQTDVVILSTTAGALAPVADLASASKLTIAGVMQATNQLYLLCYQSAVAKP